MTTFEIKESTILSTQQALANGEITSTELVKLYLHRIAEVDQAEDGTNAVLEVNPDALFIAETCDLERQQGKAEGRLHGIPILIKDNIDTADGMHTSAGTYVLQDNYAEKDAFIVQRLREEGAILLGKVNMTEWANFMSEEMPNGFSARGGQVKNPYGAFDVGGSSSGTGAAIANNLATIGIGTETSGSILSPSSSNSLVGIKPTVGLVSRSGIIPIAHSQDTAGPMTRTVEDAAILLGVLAAADPQDPATRRNPYPNKDYTVSLKTDGLRGVRLGVDRDYLTDLSEENRAVFDRALKELQQQGAEIISDIQIGAEERESSVLYHEFKHGVNRYLSNVKSHVPAHTVEEVIKWNKQHAEKTIPYGQDIMEKADETNGKLTAVSYLQDRLTDLAASQTEGIDKVIDYHKLDALVFASYFGCDIAAKAGYPSITVPGGYAATGEPVGITFTAKAFEEGKLIQIGYGYELATKHRKQPN